MLPPDWESWNSTAGAKCFGKVTRQTRRLVCLLKFHWRGTSRILFNITVYKAVLCLLRAPFICPTVWEILNPDINLRVCAWIVWLIFLASVNQLGKKSSLFATTAHTRLHFHCHKHGGFVWRMRKYGVDFLSLHTCSETT